MANYSSTPFLLGAYLGNPNEFDSSAEANYDADYNSFTSTLGAAPSYLDNYVDYTHPISNWIGNASFQAESDAKSVDARNLTPVIGLPLASTATGAGSSDSQYQAVAAGAYDSVYQGILQAYAANGYTTMVFRPGWEMNINGPTYAGDAVQDQADWIAAYKQVYTVLHEDASALGINVSVVWNPSVTNYSSAEALTSLYPGNGYVDAIGADVYADIYPYSDGTNNSGQATYHDWDTGKEDTSVAQFIADPVNRTHYFSYPAATAYSNDSSGGHALSLDQLLAFSEAQGKPFAIPETGAGNSNGGTDVSDDAAFPQWLAQQLVAAQAAGETVDFVNLWDSNGGGNYGFSDASDNKPLEAAAWAQYFGAHATASQSPAAQSQAAHATAAQGGMVVLGSGPDTLALSVSEDAWQGYAQFTVSVDGTQIGGTQTATASRAAGQSQTYNVAGTFGAGSHAVAVNFLNDAYGGSASTDRNLFVNSASFDGTAVSSSSLSLFSGGVQSFSFTGSAPAPTVAVGAGPDTLALSLSEDAWQGDAQFTVDVDGIQVGGVLTVQAMRTLAQVQTFNVNGSFGPGGHAVAVTFLNDAYGGSAATDRNLFIQGAKLDGVGVAGSTLSLYCSGTQGFTAYNTAQAGADRLDLHMSEDAWQGDAQFTISVNGITIGGVHTATAAHSAGATQDLALTGDWGLGQPTIGITFINDAYGGTAATDRNLFVDSLSYDGQESTDAPAALMSNGTVNLTTPSGSTPIALHLSEDAWQGDAQYAVSIDGKALGGLGSVTALQAQGASQTVDLQALLSPGPHDLALSFLNDAYGGTALTDRNLFLNGIDVKGTAVTGTSAAFFSGGTQHFQIVVPNS